MDSKQSALRLDRWALTAKKLLLLSLLSLMAVLLPADAYGWQRPEKIVLSGAKLENLYRIDEGVYRCEQPDSDGFAALEAIGVKEVLSLRNYHSDEWRARGSALRLYRLKTRASKIDRDDITAALAVILKRRGPIVFHCWHGSDRTGAVCAAYRVVIQGWSKEDAIDEMVNGGYGFHKQFSQIIDVIRGLDTDAVRRELGLASRQ